MTATFDQIARASADAFPTTRSARAGRTVRLLGSLSSRPA
jgi:hypothetical protein